jgi:fatty-acyl-CoA synthase
VPDFQLTLTSFLERAHDFFPDREIVSAGSALERTTYGAYYERVRRLVAVLGQLGIQRGERVATFAWNHHRHLELYFGIPAAGATLHTINIRLGHEDIGYILDHAGDRAVFIDASLLPLVSPLLEARPSIEVVVMADPGEIYEWSSPCQDYEEMLAEAEPTDGFVRVHESELAALCYTSGTTGRPKGVPYSHRTLFLHTMAAAQVDGHAISGADTILHVVPMFHANAWGMPFAGAMVGARQVLPGAHPTPERIVDLMEREKVTYTGMVPTVAAEVVRQVRLRGQRLPHLRAFVLGGSPPPFALVRDLEEVLGVPVYQGWGMTELAPMASFGQLHTERSDRSAAEFSQGRLLPGLEWKLLDDDDAELPWDGTSRGELVIRGPWAATTYYRDAAPHAFWHGWLRTGDIATIDRAGFLRIVDRKKDLIKSGGEWIAPGELEAALGEMPEVAEAAVVAVRHAKWQERPIALVVAAAGAGPLDTAELTDGLRNRFPSWWIPDRVIELSTLPRTGVGKVDKQELRSRFVDVLLTP